jgi:hypothetical protein
MALSWLLYFSVQPAASVATFHPHSYVSDFSLGASWVFSIQ